jgi:hypothetical protein
MELEGLRDEKNAEDGKTWHFKCAPLQFLKTAEMNVGNKGGGPGAGAEKKTSPTSPCPASLCFSLIVLTVLFPPSFYAFVMATANRAETVVLSCA